LVNEHRQPEALKNDERGQEVAEFMDRITEAERLNTQYRWQRDEVLIGAEKT
jgi:hypothetical protein